MENIDFGLFLTGNVSVPRVILEECGGFDESFKDYSYEDSELGYRLHQNGTCFSHEPNAIGYHFFSEPLNKICAKAYDSGRSLEVFIRLHPELYLKMQLGSITILPWRGIDIIKNIIKMILFFSCTREALKLLVKCLGKTNCDPFIFPFIPWLELAFSAKGVRAGRLKMTQ
jgi:GT2 family glycosyltransferase